MGLLPCKNIPSSPEVGVMMGLAALFCCCCVHAQNSPQDFLDAHNAARAEVGVGLMTWNTTVAGYAQNYAYGRKADCKLVHSGGPYGENIAWGSPSLTGTDAVSLWVSEKADYDYSSNTCASGKVCGHYTQVVWRDSVRLGCARVQCEDNGGWFVTCNYDPPGNYVGQRPYEYSPSPAPTSPGAGSNWCLVSID